MAKRTVKRNKVQGYPTPKIKAVLLPKDGVLEVAVPAGVVPVVAVDPVRRVVEIAPLPAKRKRSWWDIIFKD